MRQQLLPILFLFASSVMAGAAPLIVENGEPRAQIVISQHPATLTRLAAEELQTYIRKMSGAELPIVTEPGDEYPVKLYVGKSWHTDRLEVTPEGLDHGGYRLKSGDDWLVLIGQDRDFTPVGLWRESRRQWQQEGAAKWDELTGSFWTNPIGAGYPKYNKELDIWRYDKGGSFNAVCGFLRTLGVRWYMPGELGEIVPKVATIELPDMDETVRPDYRIRMVNFARYPVAPIEDLRWSLRLGVNDPYGFHTHHGIAWITSREEMKERHPEYYAVRDGERDILSRTADACLSSEGLFEENVRFLRFMFDMYDVPILSVWPADGFTRMCECEQCEQQFPDSPTRFSDYVWTYVNKVAAELEKTHPDKLISCGAYSTYREPPANIDKLHPNVVVYIVNGRRRWVVSDEEQQELRALQRRWAELSSHKLILFMNFWYANTPRLIAEDIQAMSDLCMGEDLWVSENRGLATPGWFHLNTYVTTRFWWDTQQDIDAMLEEYYRLFYGPAAEQMKAFIEFYEPNYRELGQVGSGELIKQALDRYDAAVAAVEPGTVYSQRLEMFGEGLKSLRLRYEQIAKGRGDVPEQRTYGTEALGRLTLDGKLDDEFWHNAAGRVHLPGRLVHYQTGAKAPYDTRFKFGKDKQNLYLGIYCADEPGDTTNSTTTKDDDPAIWEGDYVTVLLETPTQSYYEIAVNPAGAVIDLDHSADGDTLKWSSQIQVATYVNEEEGYWSAELRIPYTSSTDDPYHQVIGTSPRQTLPWFFNVARQRVRGDDRSLSSFSPSEEGVHNILSFGKLKR